MLLRLEAVGDDPLGVEVSLAQSSVEGDLSSDLSHASTGGNGSGGNVRKNDHVGHLEERVIGLHGLGLGDIETSSANDSLLEGLGEVLVVHDGTTRGVDDDGVLLHHLELLHVEHVLGVLVEGGVHRDEVRSLQQILEGDVLHLVVVLPVDLAADIRVDDLASEAAHSLDDLETNLSHTADTEGLSVDIGSAVAQRLPGSPTSSAHGVNSRAQAAGGGEQQSDGQLSDGVVEDTGGVSSEDSALLALRHVDVVETDGHGGDSLQLRSSSLEELSVDLIGQHAQAGVASLDGLQQLLSGHGHIRVVPVDDLHGGVSEHLHGGGGNLSGDQNLHVSTPKFIPNLGLSSGGESANELSGVHHEIKILWKIIREKSGKWGRSNAHSPFPRKRPHGNCVSSETTSAFLRPSDSRRHKGVPLRLRWSDLERVPNHPGSRRNAQLPQNAG